MVLAVFWPRIKTTVFILAHQAVWSLLPASAQPSTPPLNLPLYWPPHPQLCPHVLPHYYSPEMPIHIYTFSYDALLSAWNILVSLYSMVKSHASFKTQVDYRIISESSCNTFCGGEDERKEEGNREGVRTKTVISHIIPWLELPNICNRAWRYTPPGKTRYLPYHGYQPGLVDLVSSKQLIISKNHSASSINSINKSLLEVEDIFFYIWLE